MFKAQAFVQAFESEKKPGKCLRIGCSVAPPFRSRFATLGLDIIWLSTNGAAIHVHLAEYS